MTTAAAETSWYWIIGSILGYITAFLTFVGCWIYCAATYGFLLGFGLGWLPSAIAAVMAGGAVALLWGPIAVGLVMLIYFATK